MSFYLVIPYVVESNFKVDAYIDIQLLRTYISVLNLMIKVLE